MTDKIEEKTFEKALEELERIVVKMEDSKLPLNEMMEYFEKGKKLTDLCSRKLSEYEKKIEILVNKKTENQQEAWKDFDNFK